LGGVVEGYRRGCGGVEFSQHLHNFFNDFKGLRCSGGLWRCWRCCASPSYTHARTILFFDFFTRTAHRIRKKRRGFLTRKGGASTPPTPPKPRKPLKPLRKLWRCWLNSTPPQHLPNPSQHLPTPPDVAELSARTAVSPPWRRLCNGCRQMRSNPN
jgi:hypothetical protein